MQLNLKLSHKGLILVSVPLLFELIFVAILASMLTQAQSEIDREARARMVISQTNEVIKHILQAAAGAGMLNMTGGAFSESYEDSIAKIPAEFTELRGVVKDDPVKVAEVDHIAELWRKTATIVNECKAMVERGDRLQPLRRIPTLRRLYLDLNRALDHIVEEERPIQAESREMQGRLRRNVEQLLLLGVALNILLAVSLAVYFNRGTARRLSVLMDNTAKLARHEALNPALSGVDEIASLDKVFHDMAGQLEQSAQKERLMLDEALAAESRIRQIIESMPVGLLIVDDAGVIHTANAAAADMFKYPFTELKNANLRALIAGSPQGDDKSFTGELFDKARGRIAERMAQRKNAEQFPIELTVTDYKTVEGNLHLVIVLDLSERQEVAKLKQEFVAMVSHELRTPLTSLRAFLSLLAAGAYGPLQEPGPRKLGLIDDSVSRLINLINDLLNVQKMETGHLQMHFAPVKSADIVEGAIESVRHFAEQSEVEIVVQPMDDITVTADRDKLIQVLVNLLSNAIKYSPPNQPVSISVRNEFSKMKVKVSDKGRGIPKEHQEAVFEKFHQVDAADARIKGGTGLGLAICKAIIEQHHGEIGVDSEDGQGSTFWFAIP